MTDEIEIMGGWANFQNIEMIGSDGTVQPAPPLAAIFGPGRDSIGSRDAEIAVIFIHRELVERGTFYDTGGAIGHRRVRDIEI
ncbi:MAG: hypothetical protein NTV44_05060, partial [Firmicutes bacterium]|nr:hypothetical protein [Bacillota bacterium]